jgi:hypothetical protein
MKHYGHLVALALGGSMLAACSGGSVTGAGTTAALPPQPAFHKCTSKGRHAFGVRKNTPQICDRTSGDIKHVLFTRAYLEKHPQIKVGPNAYGAYSGYGSYGSSSSNNLQYKGGPVEVTPSIYLIFWGISGPYDTTHDPDGMAQYLVNFFTAMGGSSWINTDTQYYQTTGGYNQNITNPSAQLAGVWYDTSSSPPSNYTDAQVAQEADKGSAHFGYNANANYFVVTPTGTAESGFGTQWCAYHSIDSSNVSYTDFPYVPDQGSGCGQGSVNSPGTLDGASIVGGHEEAETQTDPGAGNGWIDSSGSEIGDKCAWMNLQNTSFPNGSTFPTQPLWSNASSSCVQSY